jgi:hypothetical protein
MKQEPADNLLRTVSISKANCLDNPKDKHWERHQFESLIILLFCVGVTLVFICLELQTIYSL